MGSKHLFSLLLCAVLACCLAACASATEPSKGTGDAQSLPALDYADSSRWVRRADNPTKVADTFFLLPVVNLKTTELGNEDIDDEKCASRFVKTLNMEAGIVSDSTNVFAPFYRQAKLGCYLDENGRVPASARTQNTDRYEDVAYEDVRNAFSYYLKNLNGGRPIVLFGFSQGANMVLRLVDEFGDELVDGNRLVAVYAIGAQVHEDYLASHPKIQMAQGEDDTGVIVSYNAVDERWLQSEEAEQTKAKEYSINPLNWKTDSTRAEASNNLGFVTVDSNGDVKNEKVGYCGAYVDERTGKLVVVDMPDDELFEADSGVFAKGDYHLYDLSLFYRNLQKNVATRVASRT